MNDQTAPIKATKPTLWGSLPLSVRQDPMLRAKLNSLVSIPPYAVPLGSIPITKQTQLGLVDVKEEGK